MGIAKGIKPGNGQNPACAKGKEKVPVKPGMTPGKRKRRGTKPPATRKGALVAFK